MSSIPGPIISFRIGGAELSGAVRPALDQIKRDAKTASTQIADEWRRMAAQIRSTTAQGSGIEKEVLSSRRELVGVLNKEIDGLRTRNELTKSQLANLKAATLELERQTSFVKGGSGLTAGTQAFAGLIGNFFQKQTALLGSSLLGIQGGSQLGAGISGALQGIAGGGVAVALGGITTAALGVAAAFHSMAVSGAETIRSLENVSEKTGISVAQLQAFKAAGATVGVSLDDLVTGFRKFSQALTAEVAGDSDEGGAAGAAKKLSAVLKDLNVSARDPKEALLEVSDAFTKMPDGAVKSAAAVALFGRSGLTMIPFLDQGRTGLEQFSKFIEQYGKITPEAIKATHDYEVANAKLSASFEKLKTDAAAHLGFLTRIKTYLAEQLLPQLDKNPGIIFGGGIAAGLIARDQAKDWTTSVGHMGDAAKSSGIDLQKLARDISDSGNSAEKATEKLKKFYEQFTPHEHFEPGRVGATNQERVDKILDQIISPKPPIVAPEIGFPTLSGAGLSGIPGFSSTSGLDALNQSRAKGLIDQINKEHDDLFTTQREKDIQHYDEELADLKFSLEQKLITTEQYNDALSKLKADEAKTLLDADKKYVDEAGKLFDDILSGNGKKIGKAIEKDILEAVLAPVKKIFSEQFGGLLGNLSRAVSIPFGGSSGGGGTAPNLGGIFGPIFGSGSHVGPGGTPGFFPGPIGSGVGGSVGVQAGQVGVATSTMNVNAGIVNVSGVLGIPGTGPLGGSTGNFFGNLNPFASGFGGGGGLATFGGIGLGGGGASGALGKLGPFLGAGALIGAGIASNNPTAMALGAATLAQAGIKSLTQFGGLISSNSGLGQALGQVAPALPGIGLFAGGVAQGGVKGTLEATAGGAQAGLVLGGPIGAAIGAGVGLISGIVSTLIQGPSFAQQVKHDMRKQAITLPPSENFSFAMGNSISQTLSTGVAQSGNSFSAFNLPANTPFFANPIHGPLSKHQQRELLQEQMGLLSNQPFLGFPGTDPFVGQGPVGRRHSSPSPTTVNFHINAIDQQGVSDFLNRNADIISRVVTSRGVSSSSSGFGSNTRRAAFLP